LDEKDGRFPDLWVSADFLPSQITGGLLRNGYPITVARAVTD